MTFLYVLLGIVSFFIIVLSIPIHISIGYDDKIRLSIRYLFVKLNILPAKSKPKKEKKPKEEKTKEDKPTPDKPKEKKPNPILDMVKANGYDGYVSIEFEGMEDPYDAIPIGMENLRRYIAE